MAEVERRRRRRVRRPAQPARTCQASGDPLSAETSGVHDPEDLPPTGNGSGTAGNFLRNGNSNAFRNGEERDAERGLRGLIGSGASQVSLTAAMRARDAARPDSTDTASAERDLTIIRRGWVPREGLPRNLR